MKRTASVARVLAMTAISITVAGQTPSIPPIEQKAGSAACSNVVLIQSTGKFQCTGLSPEQAKLLQQMPSLINKLLKNEQGDSEKIISKLDLLLANQESMARLLQELDHALNPNLPVTTYDCHGNERVTLPTGVTVRQELTGVVDQMIKLHNSRNLQALITLSQQEINKKPKWLTPYLFRAEARFYFQNYTGAIADLDYFEKNKGPAYGEGTDCDQWAKELHSKLDNIPRQ